MWVMMPDGWCTNGFLNVYSDWPALFSSIQLIEHTIIEIQIQTKPVRERDFIYFHDPERDFSCEWAPRQEN